MSRARPPEDISPLDFFTRWVPEAVASDPERRARLADTTASIEFTLIGENGGVFALEIREGAVLGSSGAMAEADLRVRLDLETWRSLNRGDIGAPEAVLLRRLRMDGSFLLGLKLHLILSA